MNRAGAPLDLQTIEAALDQFSVVVVNGGKRLFEEGRVRSLNETARPNTYEGEVHEKKAGKSYQVTLSFGKSASNLLCTCQIGSECKHVYAALLFLSKRFRKQALVLNKESKNAKKVSDYFSLVADPTLLTEKLTDFVERLEELFQTYKDGNQINGRILKGLFSDWPAEEHWSEIKIASGEPLSRVQFWHFLVANLQQRGLKVPSLFGELNDTTPSKDLIEKWNNSQEAQKWIIRFERNNEPVVYQRLDSEFRWAVDGGYLCLEVKDGNEVPYRPVTRRRIASPGDGMALRTFANFERIVALAAATLSRGCLSATCATAADSWIGRSLKWSVSIRRNQAANRGI